jgi:hypothetical protein
MTVDGFNAAQATERYPNLKQLQQDSVEPALGVVQGILPQRILGTILTQHPQLLSVDMTAWVDFLSAFGFDESSVQELLRSSPEVFYNSNVFQVGSCSCDTEVQAGGLRRSPYSMTWPTCLQSSDVLCVCAYIRLRL